MKRPVGGGVREPASGSVRFAALAIAVIASVSAAHLVRQSIESPRMDALQDAGGEAEIHRRVAANPFSRAPLGETEGVAETDLLRSGENALKVADTSPKRVRDERHAQGSVRRSASEIGITALSASDAAAREEAVLELGEAGGESAVRTLAMALDDEDAAVREAAIEALVQIGDEAAARVLGSLLYAADVALRGEAVDALGEIENEASTRLLELAARAAQAPLDTAAREYLAERR